MKKLSNLLQDMSWNLGKIAIYIFLIKNILLNDQCPLNPSEEMKTNIQTFMDMLESYGKETTIAQIYVTGGRKRRSKKTRKTRKTRRRRTRKH